MSLVLVSNQVQGPAAIPPVPLSPSVAVSGPYYYHPCGAHVPRNNGCSAVQCSGPEWDAAVERRLDIAVFSGDAARRVLRAGRW